MKLTDSTEQGDAEQTTDAGAARPPVLRRLSIALVLCILLAVACWILAPRLGVALPPIAPLLGFAVIAAGTLLGLWEAGKRHEPPSTEPSDPE